MSEELEKVTAETDSQEKDEKTTSTEIKIEVQAEISKEKLEEERPGFCCGSCS